MGRHTIFVVIAFAGLLSRQPVLAQHVPDSGAMVRISFQSRPRIVGRVIGQVGDSLMLMFDEYGNKLGIRLRDIRRVELTRGRSSAIGEGFLIGAAIGVGLGVAIGVSSHGTGDLTRSDVIRFAALDLGLLGGVSGLIIGACTTGEDWFVAPRSAARRSAMLGLGLRVRF